MPVIFIKTLPSKNKINTSKILKRITTETACETGYKPQHVWAVWEFLKPGNYAAGAKINKQLTKKTHSPLVRILSFEGTPKSTIQKMMKKIAGILSDELHIDIANVFIEYSEVLSGHVFDGGQVI